MIDSIVNQVHKALLKKRNTVSTAESCTGGLVSKLLTDTPGSSRYFILGLTAYSNKSKTKLLHIPPGLILKKGAVSREIAQRMAESARKLANSDYGIGITGIAGPSGGTPRKPVGTVFIAVSSKSKSISRKFLFTGNRSVIRKKAALKSLELFINIIK